MTVEMPKIIFFTKKACFFKNSITFVPLKTKKAMKNTVIIPSISIAIAIIARAGECCN